MQPRRRPTLDLLDGNTLNPTSKAGAPRGEGGTGPRRLAPPAPEPCYPVALCLMSLTCPLGVGIEGVSLQPKQEMVWVVACGIITGGGFTRTSAFTEFYDTCKEGRLTRNIRPPQTLV